MVSLPLQDPSDSPNRLAGPGSSFLTTVFIITVGDITFPACQEAIRLQDTQAFVLDIIRDVHPMSAAFQEMIKRCETKYFIQVDEDMILNPNAVRSMENLMRQAPAQIGMICCHLYDEDRDLNIQGIKIYRTSAMRSLEFRNVKACEMDLLEQMGIRNIRWVLHPSVQGRHGTQYSPETIYRRYKSMYEKDILQWNDVTGDIRRKAKQYRETGDLLALFALLGAVDGIVSVPNAKNQEKDYTQYNLKSLDVFRRIFSPSQSFPFPYDPGKPKASSSGLAPVLLEDVIAKPSAPASSEKNSIQNLHSVFSNFPGLVSPSVPLSVPKRILLICHWFWPSIGGVETVVADLGQELIRAGYEVDVATLKMAERTATEYQGMNIISLDDAHSIEPIGIPYCSLEVFRLLTSGQHQACVLFGDPMSAVFLGLFLGEFPSQSKVFVQLLINQEGYMKWAQHQTFKERLFEALKKTEGVLALTRNGLDTKVSQLNGVRPLHLPNATTPAVSRVNFREQFNIPLRSFLIVHVGNIFRVKNQLGLLESLSGMPADWRMVLIGKSFGRVDQEEEEYTRRFEKAVRQRPDIQYIPGLPKEDAGAAMKSADVVVLASHAEVSPMVIVEAMSHGTPWLATPECGDVAEKAGGIVAPLELFPVVLTILQQNPALRQALGQLGYAHWKACFSWDVVMKGWRQILETGSLSESYDMPREIADSMNHLQRRLNDLLASLSFVSEPLQPQLPEEKTNPEFNRSGSLPFPHAGSFRLAK
ncbi:MAG: glycosyltransferase [Nitrospirales bacterium]